MCVLNIILDSIEHNTKIFIYLCCFCISHNDFRFDFMSSALFCFYHEVFCFLWYKVCKYNYSSINCQVVISFFHYNLNMSSKRKSTEVVSCRWKYIIKNVDCNKIDTEWKQLSGSFCKSIIRKKGKQRIKENLFGSQADKISRNQNSFSFFLNKIRPYLLMYYEKWQYYDFFKSDTLWEMKWYFA